MPDKLHIAINNTDNRAEGHKQERMRDIFCMGMRNKSWRWLEGCYSAMKKTLFPDVYIINKLKGKFCINLDENPNSYFIQDFRLLKSNKKHRKYQLDISRQIQMSWFLGDEDGR